MVTNPQEGSGQISGKSAQAALEQTWLHQAAASENGGGRPDPLLTRDNVRIAFDGETLREIGRMLLRNGWTILFITAAMLMAVVVHEKLSESTYVARASVVVKLGREFQHNDAERPGRSGSMYRLEEALNSVTEILESRGLAFEAVADVGIATLYPDFDREDVPQSTKREKAIEAFRDALVVRGIADSSVIEASFEHFDREVAIRALDALVANLGERQLEVFAGSGASVLQAQLERVERELEGSAAALRTFQQETGVFDVDHQVQILLTQRSQVGERADAARARLDEIERALPPALAGPLDGDSIRDGDASASSTGVEDLTEDLPSPITFKDNRALAEAHAQLLALHVQSRQLSAQYAPDSRRLTSLREEMALLRDFLFGAAEDELQAQRALVGSLETQADVLDVELAELLERGNELRNLQSQHTANENLFQEYLGRVESARIDAELDRQKQSSIAVLDPASAPLEPIGLSLSSRILLALVVGLGLGVIATLFQRRAELFA